MRKDDSGRTHARPSRAESTREATDARTKNARDPAAEPAPAFGNRRMQRLLSGSSAIGAARAPSLSSAALRPSAEVQGPSDGRALDGSARAAFERGFGADLSDVRIHTDAAAAASAEALNAEAYTVGRDIVFGPGRYRPDTADGRALLAHELAHAQQQKTAPAHGGSPSMAPANGDAERDAERAANAVMAGRTAQVAARDEPASIARQPKKTKRADRFLPNEKAKLKAMGRGEIDELIDAIVADGAYHRIRQQTVGGVEHTWEVKTEIVELSEEEQTNGAKFGGALTPDKTTASADGKTMLHQNTYILRGGQASTLQSALHELIHLRISIDRSLPPEDRSSFYREYEQAMELSEVTQSAKFGAKGTLDDKASYGALPLVTGDWAWAKNLLKKIDAIRTFYIGLDPAAEAKFDRDPSLSPATLMEYVVQEKYVTQTAARESSKTAKKQGNAPSNETVATRYAGIVARRFEGLIDPAASARTDSGTGRTLENERIADLTLALRKLYEAIDKSAASAKAAAKNPPPMPDMLLPNQVFESRPLDIQGQPVPFK